MVVLAYLMKCNIQEIKKTLQLFLTQNIQQIMIVCGIGNVLNGADVIIL